MMVVDDRGVILFANREAERDFGYSRETLAGHPIEALVPGRIQSVHARLREAYLARPEARQMGAGRHLLGRRFDGSEFPVEVGLTPVQVEARTFVVVSAIDITATRVAEETTRRTVEDRLAFESLISEISAAFINLPADQLDAAITDALRRIVEALDLDRAVLFLLNEPGDDLQLGPGWARCGVLTDERLSVAALIDDTEATNWASLNSPFAGKQVTVRLDPSKPFHTIRRIQVSAMVRHRIPADPQGDN